MYNNIFFLSLFFLFLIGCQSSDYHHNVPDIPTTLDSLYDDYAGNQVLKVRKIFRKGISYRYKASYLDEKDQVITENFVEIIPTGERWEHQPEKQDVVRLRFGYTEEEKALVLANPLNKTLDLESRWTSETMEGVIENENEVWMHPIRHNQYVFTEVAAFPAVRFPIEVGNEWKSGLGGLGGWGDWDGMDIFSSYKVLGKEKIKLPIGKIECWLIQANSSFPLGQSTAIFYFHEDLGFIKMDYINYVDQRLTFELEEVKEVE